MARKIRTETVLLMVILILMGASAPITEARQYLDMDRPRLGIELSYEFEDERRTGPNIDSKDTTGEFRESLEIETKGWLYHPALCKYTFRFEPEWSQTDETHDPGEDSSGNAYLSGYFADATFLRSKPYTLHLFGHKREATLTGAFASKSSTTTDTYGGDLSFTYKVLPTTLTYTHLESRQKGFYSSEEDSDDYRMSMSHNYARSDTRLTADYTDTTRTSRQIGTSATIETTNETRTSNSDLHNYYTITEDKRIKLGSTVSYRWTESDFYDTESTGISEHLFWKHRENLRSDYQASYTDSKSGDFDRQTTAVNAGLTHLLYENLTTKIGGNASLNDYSEGTEKTYGADLAFTYNRTIPWGSLHITMAYDYEVTNREFAENHIQVTDESHLLNISDVTLLNSKYVDAATIRVTNDAGTIIYIENIDYRIAQIGSSIRISRTTFGAIAEGDQVLVSYTYLSNPDYDDARFSQTYGVSVDLWASLTLSYGYSHAKQEILSGIAPDDPVDDTSHTATMRYDLGWTNTKLSYNDTERSSGTSTRRWLAEETLTYRPFRELYFSLSGHYGRTKFKDTGETEKFYGAKSDMDWALASWCHLGADAFRETISGKTQETVDTGFSSTLSLYYRIWSSSLKYEYINEKDEQFGDERTKYSVVFEIARTLW